MKLQHKVIIVEDNKRFSEALSFYLAKKLHHKVVHIAHCAADFFSYENLYKCDIIFMDIELPDQNGIDIAKNILAEYPFLKIIGMTMYEDDIYLTEIISAGFKGVLFKSNFYEKLEWAIISVQNGKLFFPNNIKLKRN